jgi:hypothetical protein
MVQSGHEQEMLGSPSGLMVPNDLAAMGANSPQPYDYFYYNYIIDTVHAYCCNQRCIHLLMQILSTILDRQHIYIYIDWIR